MEFINSTSLIGSTVLNYARIKRCAIRACCDLSGAMPNCLTPTGAPLPPKGIPRVASSDPGYAPREYLDRIVTRERMMLRSGAWRKHTDTLRRGGHQDFKGNATRESEDQRKEAYFGMYNWLLNLEHVELMVALDNSMEQCGGAIDE